MNPPHLSKSPVATMDQDAESEPLFRPFKKRKFIRKREESEHETQGIPVVRSSEAPSLPPNEDDEPNIGELLKARKTDKSRWHGVSFTNTPKPLGDHRSRTSARSLVRHDPEIEHFKAITDRFVPHTGQPTDVDKHMIDYIESELAKRRLGTSAMNPENEADDEYSPNGPKGEQSRPFEQRQPVSFGRIQEIDLGQDATLRNTLRTEMAVRKQNGESVIKEEHEERPPKPRRIRIGRDGKPMRPRPRRGPKRRNSEDVQRDKLVEEVLRETKLEIYDAPSDEFTDEDDELETDDRVAEQFKQDFIEAMQSRKRARNAGQPKPPGTAGAKVGEAPKGPKLGGSRNMRAAMREREMQQTGKK